MKLMKKIAFEYQNGFVSMSFITISLIVFCGNRQQFRRENILEKFN